MNDMKLSSLQRNGKGAHHEEILLPINKGEVGID